MAGTISSAAKITQAADVDPPPRPVSRGDALTSAGRRTVHPLRPSDQYQSSELALQKVAQASRNGKHWQRSFRLRAALTDVAVIVLAVAVAQIVRFGLPADLHENFLLRTSYSVALVVTWIIALGAQQSWDLSLSGCGSEEYRRVVIATAWVCGVIAATALAFQLYPFIARGYLLIAIPLGLMGLLIGRRALRRSLARKRAVGEYTSQVVVLGSNTRSIAELCACLGRDKSAGHQVVGACITGFDGQLGEEMIETESGAVPVLGDEQAIETALKLTGADTLAVTATEHLGHQGMRTLAWQLDALQIDLIVAPGLTDIAGPRLKIRPIDNLPLFHVARARRDLPSRVQKRIFDLVVGSAALLFATPIMLAAAIAIKLEDRGPIFFRQSRVGYRGVPFRIVKFRTMLVDADSLKDNEQQTQEQSNVVFYKSASDSRITRVGRFLRKTSIDELPQLFNVLGGTMSLVGPRPLVPGEGRSVRYFVERRSLVKPGMTGLWQVSGRSDVSEEQRIRLDHLYVDNWSPVLDLVIVWRTVHAVLRKQGAY